MSYSFVLAPAFLAVASLTLVSCGGSSGSKSKGAPQEQEAVEVEIKKKIDVSGGQIEVKGGALEGAKLEVSKEAVLQETEFSLKSSTTPSAVEEVKAKPLSKSIELVARDSTGKILEEFSAPVRITIPLDKGSISPLNKTFSSDGASQVVMGINGDKKMIWNSGEYSILEGNSGVSFLSKYPGVFQFVEFLAEEEPIKSDIVVPKPENGSGEGGGNSAQDASQEMPDETSSADSKESKSPSTGGASEEKPAPLAATELEAVFPASASTSESIPVHIFPQKKISGLTISVSKAPQKGRAYAVGQALFYRPSFFFSGTDSFQVKLSHESGTSITRKVTVKVVDIDPGMAHPYHLAYLKNMEPMSLLKAADMPAKGKTKYVGYCKSGVGIKLYSHKEEECAGNFSYTTANRPIAGYPIEGSEVEKIQAIQMGVGRDTKGVYHNFSMAVLRAPIVPNQVTYVRSVEDFKNIKNDPFGHYILKNDLDFKGTTISENLIERFYGVLDGDGFALKNIKVADNTEERISLIAHVIGASIKNITFSNTALSTKTRSAHLIRHALSATFSDIKIENVTLRSQMGGTGALVGHDDGSTFLRIKANKIQGELISNFSGGLVGQSTMSRFSDIVLSDIKFTMQADSIYPHAVQGGLGGTCNSCTTYKVTINSSHLEGKFNIGGLFGRRTSSGSNSLPYTRKSSAASSVKLEMTGLSTSGLEYGVHKVGD